MLMAVAAGCGPQVAVDGTGTGTDDSGSGTMLAPTAEGSDTATGPGTSDPDPSDSGDVTGVPPPAPTWCVAAQEFPGESWTLHTPDVGGRGPELWSVIPEIDPASREPITWFLVQHYDGSALVEIAHYTREGTFLAFGDVDGDGRDDAIMSTGGGAHVWLAGEGSGQVSEKARPFAIEYPEFAVFGDRNGDGVLDAMVSSQDVPSVLDVHVGDGSGGFSLAGSLEVGIEHFSFHAHPLGERRVLIDAEYVCIGFCSPASEVIVVDVAEDGFPSELARLSVDGIAEYIDAIDRNGDGLPDLLLNRADRESTPARISWHDSPGYAESIHLDPVAVVRSADVDLDGAVDLIESTGPDEAATIRFGVTGEGFGPQEPLVGQLPSGVPSVEADFDGDGRLDLVTRSGTNTDFTIWSIVPCEG
jgi:hypothetical protein